MTTLHILLAIGAFLFLLPGLLIFILTTLTANSQIPFQLLNEMPDVPEEHKVAARASFQEARARYKRTLIYNATAPYVMLFVLPFVKWEADRLPSLFRKWDNEVNLNGDRFPWYVNKDENGNVAGVLVDSAKVEVDYVKATGQDRADFLEGPPAYARLSGTPTAHNPFPVSVRHRIGDGEEESI